MTWSDYQLMLVRCKTDDSYPSCHSLTLFEMTKSDRMTIFRNNGSALHWWTKMQHKFLIRIIVSIALWHHIQTLNTCPPHYQNHFREVIYFIGWSGVRLPFLFQWYKFADYLNEIRSVTYCIFVWILMMCAEFHST